MTTFYIARHGQTENNKEGRFSGWIDTPLTENGIKDARSSAAKLKGIKFDKIISSDMGRAFVTAYIISRIINHKGEIELNKGLREVNYGDLANMPYSMYPELSPHENAIYVSPNGESLVQVQQRIIGCINTISLENQSKTILLVAHDGTINAIRASFTDKNIGLVDAERLNKHDTVVKFVYDKGKIVTIKEVN